jgi:hypothetical protein
MASSRTSRFWYLARLLGRTAGKNALRSSLPLYLTVGIGAFVLFGGNGLDAGTVVALATKRVVFGCSLTLLWVLATLPVARAVFASPETFFLRALPIPRGEFLAVLGAGLLFAHAPWAALWWRGGGFVAALSVTLVALAVELHIVAGFRTSMDFASFALAVVAFLLGPSLAASVLAAPAFWIGLRRAWIRAPEPRSVGRHAIWGQNRSLALASALAISVYRGHPPVIVRALLLALAACVFVVLGLRNNELSDPTAVMRVSLMVWGPACAFGAVGIAGPLLSAEAGARWILDVCGVSAWQRSAVSAALLAAWAGLLGAGYGVLAGQALELAPSLRVVLALGNAAGGAGWAGITMSLVRMTRSSGGRAAGRLLMALSALCVISAALLAIQPLVMIGFVLLLAGLLAVVAARTTAGA